MPKTVPPSIHEASVNHHRNSDDAQDPLFEALADAAKECRVSAETALEITTTTMASTMNTVSANASRSRAAGFKVLERAALKVDAARKSAEQTIEKIEAATAAPPRPKDAMAALLAQEIRSALIRMSQKDRAAAISKAIADGDDEFVGAALHAPELLSGLGTAEREVFRDAWRRKKFLPEMQRVERLRKAVWGMETAARVTMSFIDSLTDARAVATAERLEGEAKAALAKAA